jgi:hypothetical protein
MKYLVFFCLCFIIVLDSFAQAKELPATPPSQFGKILNKIIEQSGKEYSGIIGKEKPFSENLEFKQFYSKECLPLADSCFLFQEINDDFDVFYVFEAAYGLYRDKELGLKAFNNLVQYIKNDPIFKKSLKAEPADESDDEVVQIFMYKHGVSSTTLVSIVLESNEAYHPALDQDLEFWKLYLNVSEEYSN